MSTVHICAGCAREMERYGDDPSYVEIADCLCPGCATDAQAFDAAFDAYEARAGWYDEEPTQGGTA